MNIQHFDDKALLFMHTDHINLLALLLFFFFFLQHVCYSVLYTLPLQGKQKISMFSDALEVIFLF